MKEGVKFDPTNYDLSCGFPITAAVYSTVALQSLG
jgi:hypothetical protein